MHIYLVREREFIRLKENVYKIGMTDKGYYKPTKGSLLLLIIVTYNGSDDFATIIKAFKSKYIHRPELGSRYFQGNRNDMIADIIAIVNKIKENDLFREWVKTLLSQIDKVPNPCPHELLYNLYKEFYETSTWKKLDMSQSTFNKLVMDFGISNQLPSRRDYQVNGVTKKADCFCINAKADIWNVINKIS